MNAKQILERCDHLQALRSPHEYLWTEIGYLTNAKHLQSNKGVATKGFIPHTDIHDTTLRTKSRMQANGITSMLFPRDKDWLRLKTPYSLKKNKSLEKVYREAGEAVMEYLRSSNFHHVNHGIITHRSQLGTGTMAMEWVTNDNGSEEMNFRKYQPMEYYIDHDSRGKVQTFACEYNWSAKMAADEWGIDSLSAKLQSEAKDPAKSGTKHCFLMLIEKAPQWEVKGKGDKLYNFNVIEKQTKTMVVKGGMNTFDIVASRYEIYDSPWGYSPAWEILPDAYKANYAAKFMLVMGERAAVPPILAPASMKEEGVGLGAAEVTYVSDVNPNLWPKELSGGGNYQVGMEIWKNYKDSIDEAYHGTLFNMFSRSTKQMTQFEAMSMKGELNSQIDPTITALNQDHTDPVVTWSFNSLVERGIIELPDEAMNQVTGKPLLPMMAYDNAITMNHKKQRALEAMGLVDNLVNLAGAGANVDVVKMNEVARRIWRDNGQDEDDLLSEEEYQSNQQGKADAQQSMAQAEQAKQGASVAKDLASAGVDVGAMQ